MPRILQLNAKNGLVYDNKYIQTHIKGVEGLLDENDEINYNLLPSAVFNGMKQIGTYGGADQDFSYLCGLADDFVADNPQYADYLGIFLVCSADFQINISQAGYTVKDEDGDHTSVSQNSVRVQKQDYIYFNGPQTATIINNSFPLATASVKGLMSSTDKAKLDAIAPGANNYVHHTQAAIAIDTVDNEVIDTLTVDTEGHVTGAAKRTLSPSTTTKNGLMSSLDKTKLDTIEDNATVGAIETNHYTPNNATINESISESMEIYQIYRDSNYHVTSWTARNKAVASYTAKGIVELATAAEVQIGTDNEKAVTPYSFKAALDFLQGLPLFASQAAADASAAAGEHLDGSFAFIDLGEV